MLKINFEYNLRKDAYNWARQVIFASHSSINHIPSEIQEKIKQLYKKKPISHTDLIEFLNHPAIDFVADYLRETQDFSLIESKQKKLEQEWEKRETEFFKILSNVLQKPIYEASYTCYLSTTYNCPFNQKENWFMVSAFSEIANQIYVIAHEFMHLQFIHWYKEYCSNKGLTNKDFWNLQEAMAFLLNEPEFDGIISFQDEGRNAHQELIQKLRETRQKNKDFKYLLDTGIKLITELNQ